MATEVTNTENAAVIPQYWDREIIGALYDDHGLGKRFLNKSQDVSKDGDKVNISVAPSLTVQTVGSDGAVTKTAPTVTAVVLTVDTHKAIVYEWIKKTVKQSFGEWWNSLPGAAGAALRQDIEAAILALGSGFTSNTAVGDGLGHADADMFTAQIGTLIRAKLDPMTRPDEFSFIYDGKEFEYIRRLNILDYSVTGRSGEGGGATANIPRVYGIPFYFSNQVQSSSDKNQNLLAHRTALAWAVQSDVDLGYASGLPSLKLTSIFSADVLYGVKEVVDARAVRGLTTDL